MIHKTLILLTVFCLSKNLFAAENTIDSASKCKNGGAQFYLGQSELYNFIANNLIYPDSAIKKSISGTIIINFIVDTMGRVEFVEGKEKIPKSKMILFREAKRLVLSTSGMWIPACENGKKVRNLCRLPIAFELE